MAELKKTGVREDGFWYPVWQKTTSGDSLCPEDDRAGGRLNSYRKKRVYQDLLISE
ncbi:hypothetical protein [Atlantibacter subterraneus]|uniref:hypothetical protein n=1 Tax=Atlantibacter subterraneus TaxID=255519 RepID=UPI00142EAC34|nr:hypothetical protein [Atlantibacter subterranea]